MNDVRTRPFVDQDYRLFVGSYSDLNVLAHQPCAPIPGSGIYGLTLHRDGRLELNGVTQATNPAVLIPGGDKGSLYAITETIATEGEVLHYAVESDGDLRYLDSFRASGR